MTTPPAAETNVYALPRRPRSLAFCWHQLQADRVDAVPLVGGRGVALALEDVAKVAVAVRADDLGACHAKAAVLAQDDPVAGQWAEERRPAAVGVELRVAAEELRAARSALVHADRLGVGVLPGPRAFRAGLAQDRVLLRGQ